MKEFLLISKYMSQHKLVVKKEDIEAAFKRKDNKI
jgi:hypothetical protein